MDDGIIATDKTLKKLSPFINVIIPVTWKFREVLLWRVDLV